LYVAYAVPQDGITAPVDFNVYQSASLTNLLVASGSPKAGSITGPDASGYFTATLTGDTLGQAVGTGCTKPTAPAVATCVNTAVLASPIVIPSNAKMVTGAIIGSFTQKGLTDYPYVAANVAVNPTTSASGGLARPAVLKKVAATGYTARRVIVSAAKCNTCHDQLGTNPNFHGGARNDPTACNFCHNNTRTSNGWVANSNTFIHGIHGAEKRSNPYMWAATSATDNFSLIGYPGVLKDCNQCHLTDTVNYGASGMTLQPNLLWPTGATGIISTTTNTFRNSPYVTAGKNYGNNFSFTSAGATVAAYTKADGTVVAAHVAGAGGEIVAPDAATLVSTPISAACFSCHDTQSAKNHMVTNGGAVYEARSTALTKGEACLVCHGAGKEFDAAAVHAK
jgi:OmcA/MtrC family decaheme c-type cytochrome